jgi:hypothetical protein
MEPVPDVAINRTQDAPANKLQRMPWKIDHDGPAMVQLTPINLCRLG